MSANDQAKITNMKQLACAEVDRRQHEIIGLSSAIFAHPEPAFQEQFASATLTKWLTQQGFDIETCIAGLDTAFKARKSAPTPGPSIALLSEYDALPELGHACGHNIIAASGVGAAVVVGELLPDIRGTVLSIGTPAEEYGGGKITMVAAGVFSDVDAALIVHPASNTILEMYALANQTIEVEFFGEPAHAAADPEQGINALDAMLLSYNNINALRQQMRSDARVHGIITKGGDASNIIPAHTAGRFQVRAKDDVYLDILLEKVLDCFRAGALATGARFEYRLTEGRYNSMVNNKTMAAAFGANLHRLGIHIDAQAPTKEAGSTDMGNVSQAIPSIHPTLAIAPSSVSLHTNEFAQAAGSRLSEKSLIAATKALAMTTIDLLLDDELMKHVKEEFRHSV